MCDWLEHYLVHGRGPLMGKPYKLHDDLRRFVWESYELNADGTRRWSEEVLAQPKGWAKSEAAGALCCVEALGPVRFDGWDAAGDPVAAPVPYALIEIYANDEQQTENTYGNVSLMLGQDTCRDELLADFGRIDIGRHDRSSTRVILPDHRGEITPKSTRARSKQGGLPTFVVIEETHEWQLPDMHDLYDTKVKDLLKISASTNTWALHATNWFGEGEGSVLEKIRADWEAGARGLLWFGRSCPKELLPKGPLKKATDEQLQRALRAVYGSAASFANFGGLIDYLRRKSTKEGVFRRFYLNQPFARDTSWQDPDVWKERATGERLSPRDRVGLGFVGVDRCVALVACRVDDRLIQPLAIWEDEDPSPSGVAEAVADAFEQYRVARLLGNPWGWRTELDDWAGKYGQKVVLRFPLREDRRMREALDRWASGAWRHTGDEKLTAHVLACSARTEKQKTESGSVDVPVNLEPKEAHLWIVAAQAAVLAHEAACQALAAPAPPERPAPAVGRRTAPSPGTPARPTSPGYRPSRLPGRRL